MKIIYSSKFEREYKKLPNNVKNAAEEKEKIFRKNPFDKRLETHKLHGKLKDFWSFSINYGYRIIFEITKDKRTAYFHSVGNHKIYS
jgi:addiction module RelE/StbE family toxin